MFKQESENKHDHHCIHPQKATQGVLFDWDLPFQWFLCEATGTNVGAVGHDLIAQVQKSGFGLTDRAIRLFGILQDEVSFAAEEDSHRVEYGTFDGWSDWRPLWFSLQNATFQCCHSRWEQRTIGWAKNWDVKFTSDIPLKDCRDVLCVGVEKGTEWGGSAVEDGFPITDWVTAQDAVSAIMIALRDEAIEEADRLMELAELRFGRSDELRGIKTVLCPPKLLGMEPSSEEDEDLETSQRWVSENAYRYKGLWIAVRNGELVASSSTFKELKQAVGAVFSSCLVVRVEKPE